MIEITNPVRVLRPDDTEDVGSRTLSFVLRLLDIVACECVGEEVLFLPTFRAFANQARATSGSSVVLSSRYLPISIPERSSEQPGTKKTDRHVVGCPRKYLVVGERCSMSVGTASKPISASFQYISSPLFFEGGKPSSCQ